MRNTDEDRKIAGAPYYHHWFRFASERLRNDVSFVQRFVETLIASRGGQGNLFHEMLQHGGEDVRDCEAIVVQLILGNRSLHVGGAKKRKKSERSESRVTRGMGYSNDYISSRYCLKFASERVRSLEHLWLLCLGPPPLPRGKTMEQLAVEFEANKKVISYSSHPLVPTWKLLPGIAAELLTWAPDSIRDSDAVMALALDSDCYCVRFASPRLQHDEAWVRHHVLSHNRNRGNSHSRVDHEHLRNPSTKEPIATVAELFKGIGRNGVVPVVGNDCSSASGSRKSNGGYAAKDASGWETHVRRQGVPPFAYLSPRLRDNEEILELACGFFPESFLYASERLRESSVKAACTAIWAIGPVSDSWKKIEKIFDFHINPVWRKDGAGMEREEVRCAPFLAQLHENLRDSPTVNTAACVKDARALRFASDRIRSGEGEDAVQVLHTALKQNVWDALECVGDTALKENRGNVLGCAGYWNFVAAMGKMRRIYSPKSKSFNNIAPMEDLQDDEVEEQSSLTQQLLQHVARYRADKMSSEGEDFCAKEEKEEEPGEVDKDGEAASVLDEVSNCLNPDDVDGIHCLCPAHLRRIGVWDA
ncbi:unnamed protein product [Amoebophrya sp. A120]|nr:unnamed protein product [Amoebophrya sp. A120]|eukprot:GSA120T00011582001.1